jgi:hypothetical protein
MQIRQQGGSWGGNFAPNDFVLWTNNNGNGNGNGPLTISFANPVFGAGAQIQANAGGNFTVNLTAYDGSDNVLGNFTSVGNSNANADNSAIFIGVNDNVASISKLIFSLPVNGYPQDFGINRLAIATAVPWETDVLSVVGTTILFGFGVWAKSKSTKPIQK